MAQGGFSLQEFTCRDNSILFNIEHVIGSNYDDIMRAAGDIEKLSGGNGSDNLVANASKSTKLFGGEGTDILTARIAKDGYKHELYGGKGSDVFVLCGDENIPSLDNNNTVGEFFGEYCHKRYLQRVYQLL